MDNQLKNFFSNIKLFQGSSDTDRALGVDVGTSSIKVVEIKKRGGKVALETYGSVALGPYGEKEIGQVTNLSLEKTIEALNEVLKQSGATTRSSAISIPIQSSLVFTLDLPPQISTNEIPNVIPIEARKHIPIPITEVSLDYFVFPSKEPSFEEANNPEYDANAPERKEVLVVAIQNEAVSKYRSLASGCNLQTGFFELEIFSSIRANFERELSLVLLMDFGASRTKLSLVEFGMVKAHHTIHRGGADITDSLSKTLSISFTRAEEMKRNFGVLENPEEKKIPDIIKTHLDYIFSETNNVLLRYQRKYNQTISKVILTGGGATLKGLKDIAVANFQAEVEIGKPFSKVSAPAFLDNVLLATGPEFAVATGLALRKLQ